MVAPNFDLITVKKGRLAAHTINKLEILNQSIRRNFANLILLQVFLIYLVFNKQFHQMRVEVAFAGHGTHYFIGVFQRHGFFVGPIRGSKRLGDISYCQQKPFKWDLITL